MSECDRRGEYFLKTRRSRKTSRKVGGSQLNWDSACTIILAAEG